MKWQKPLFEERRYGFEVTMYIYQKTIPSTNLSLESTNAKKPRYTDRLLKPLVFAVLLLMGTPAWADVDSNNNKVGEWRLSGFGRTNNADSSAVSRITPNNVGNLQIDWIYNIAPIPLTNAGTTGIGSNPVNNARPAFGALNLAVDRNQRVYANTNDGRIIILNGNQLAKTLNPDGTNAPVPAIQSTGSFGTIDGIDLFGDPKYTANDTIPGSDVFVSRMHVTLVGNAMFAGNDQEFSATQPLLPLTPDPNHPGFYLLVSQTEPGSGIIGPNYLDKATDGPSLSNPNFVNAGAVLYSLDRRSGALNWKTVIDNNPQTSIRGTGGTPIYGITAPDGSKDDILVVPFDPAQPSGTLGLYPLTLTPATGHPNGLVVADPFASHCCDFRGGVAGVRMSDGKVLWKTYHYPKQTFYNTQQVVDHGSINTWIGGGEWGGGNLAYSKKLNLVFIGTDEAFSAPDYANQCEIARMNTPGSDPNACLHIAQNATSANDTCMNNGKPCTYQDNIVEQAATTTQPQINSPTLPMPDTIYALNPNNGQIVWAQPTGGFDVWNFSCFQFLTPFFGGNPTFGSVPITNSVPFCNGNPAQMNPFIQFANKDADAAATPLVVENVNMNGITRDVVIGGGKAGNLYAFDAQTGARLWTQSFFPNGVPIGSGSFIWGLASDGTNVYGLTGQESSLTLGQLQDAQAGNNPNHIVLDGSCITQGGASGFGGFSGNTRDATWQGGLYVAVNIATGNIAWERCAIGQIGAPNRPLTTLTPVADCINANGLLPSGSTSTCDTHSITSPPSVSNGVLIVSGISNYNDNGVPNSLQPFGELLLLNASNGQLLRELPYGVKGQPSANPVIYSRSFAVGKSIYTATGTYLPAIGALPNQSFNRIIKFSLTNDSDNYNDDQNTDAIQEDVN